LKRRRGAFGAALLLGAILSGPAAGRGENPPPPSETESARQAAERFLALVDAGKSSGSWDAAAQIFKDATPRGPWAQTLHRLRYPLGKAISRKFKDAESRESIPGFPDGEYVVVQFETHFENKDEGVETVIPTKEKDGAWRVAGYFIK